MDSDEEPDYMSDTFLESISGKEDIRPGLLRGHAQKYDHKRAVNKMESDEKNKVKNPSLKEQEATNRQTGLDKPLDSDNVGFKMMQKLGFKSGVGLGKSGEGRVEPIAVEVKSDRQGLGRKSSLEEIRQMRARYRAEAKQKLLNINDYRLRKSEEVAERQAKMDLYKSQRVCWQLDTEQCIEEPAECWFWPETKLPKTEENEDEEDVCDEDNINKDNPSSTDNEDLNQSCEEHTEEYTEDEYTEDEDFSVQEKLEMLTLYLRRTYLYCVWCGHNFDDEKDLQQDCPGPSRADH